MIATFMEASMVYKVSAAQKVEDFHNLFEDMARISYRSYVQPTRTTFKVCIKTSTQYSTIARQNEVRKHLQNWSVLLFMEKKS